MLVVVVGPVIAAELTGVLLAGKAPRLILSEEDGLAQLRGASALVLQRHSGKRRTRAAAAPKREATRASGKSNF